MNNNKEKLQINFVSFMIGAVRLRDNLHLVPDENIRLLWK